MILKYESISDFSKYAVDEIPQTDTGDLWMQIEDDFTFTDQSQVKGEFFETLLTAVEKLVDRKFRIVLDTGDRDVTYCNISIDADFFANTDKLKRAEERATAFIIQYDEPHIRYNFDGVKSANILSIINHLYNDLFDYNIRKADERRVDQKAEREREEQDKAEGKRFKRSEKKQYKIISLTIRNEPTNDTVKEEEPEKKSIKLM